MPSLKDLKEKGDVPPRASKLSPKEKEEWASNGVIFAVTSVTHHPDGDNGPYWTVTADEHGEEVSFDLQGHESRNPQMAALQSLSVQEPITDCVLVKLTERAGNAFLVIDSADTMDAHAAKGK